MAHADIEKLDAFVKKIRQMSSSFRLPEKVEELLTEERKINQS